MTNYAKNQIIKKELKQAKLEVDVEKAREAIHQVLQMQDAQKFLNLAEQADAQIFADNLLWNESPVKKLTLEDARNNVLQE